MSRRLVVGLVAADLCGLVLVAACDPVSVPPVRVVVVADGERVPNVSPPDVLVVTGLTLGECAHSGGRMLADGSCFGVDY